MAKQPDAQGQEWVDEALREADERAAIGPQQAALNDTIDYAWAATEAHGDARPWDEDEDVALPPAAQREVDKLQGEIARRHPELDNAQRIQFNEAANAQINAITQEAVPVNVPNAPSVEEEFNNRVIERDGRLLQQDEQTGTFSMLADNAAEANNAEQMQLQQRVEHEKAKDQYKQQLASATNAEGKPLNSVEEIEAKAEKLFGESPMNAARQEVNSTVNMMPASMQQLAAPFTGEGATEAEFESVANITGRIRKYWNRRAGRYMLDPGDMALAQAEIQDMTDARGRYDAELDASRRQREAERERTDRNLERQWERNNETSDAELDRQHNLEDANRARNAALTDAQRKRQETLDDKETQRRHENEIKEQEDKKNQAKSDQEYRRKRVDYWQKEGLKLPEAEQAADADLAADIRKRKADRKAKDAKQVGILDQFGADPADAGKFLDNYGEIQDAERELLGPRHPEVVGRVVESLRGIPELSGASDEEMERIAKSEITNRIQRKKKTAAASEAGKKAAKEMKPPTPDQIASAKPLPPTPSEKNLTSGQVYRIVGPDGREYTAQWSGKHKVFVTVGEGQDPREEDYAPGAEPPVDSTLLNSNRLSGGIK